MTKADIVNEIAKNTGIEKVTVQKTVEALMETVKDIIPAHNIPAFKPAKSFITKVKSHVKK
jgi:DNA-binding protein HU-beta